MIVDTIWWVVDMAMKTVALAAYIPSMKRTVFDDDSSWSLMMVGDVGVTSPMCELETLIINDT